MSHDLTRALDLHQRGALDEAAQAYSAILTQDPRHADALHLLGVLRLQQGNAAQAIEQIGRAIAVNAQVPAFHCNLGEAHRCRGDLDRAIASCRAALLLRPDYPEAWNNAGLALQAQGRLDKALAAFTEALRARPDFALALNNLGTVQREQGTLDAALTSFRRAVELEPGSAEARSNLGQLLLERHQLEDALDHCQAAIRLRPDLPFAQNNLGNVLRELGRLEEAKACYTEALRLEPSLAMTSNNMGQALQEEGRLDEALTWYARALASAPRTARFHTNAASALAEQERTAEAVAHYETALRHDPAYAEAHSGLAAIRHDEGRYAEAQDHFAAALRANPDLAPAHSGLGGLCEELGDFEQAESHFRAALSQDPRHLAALAQLATLLRGKLPDADFQKLKASVNDPAFNDQKRTALGFALAQVCDARKQHVEAAVSLRQANALRLASWRQQGKGYDPAEHSRFVDRLSAGFSSALFERLRGSGVESERPIFIVGLPRSGTTLVEQILASHSQVHGAGELRFARETFESLPQTLHVAGDPIDILPRLDAACVRLLAERHLERLAELDSQAARIADKMPDNYLYLGLLAILFPHARFIHCCRDLRDIAVSCWMTNFRQIRWANDQGHIAARFADYVRISTHWRQVLPIAVHEVAYEETVADIEGVARRLVAWCGLDWEPSCLAFHETRRPVRTASVTQVREPIYTRSVERWRFYAEELASLFARLEKDDRDLRR